MINRELTEIDVSQVTTIHLKAFNDYFLSQMGENFLNLYYRSFLKDKKGFGVGIFDEEGCLLGFSVATTHSNGFNKSLIVNNIIPFSVIGLNLLFSNPKSLIRLIKNLTKNNNRAIDDGDYAELYSIAVDPDKQAIGIGKKLLLYIENKAIENGCKRITLTTDYYNNSNAVDFYKKNGYSVFYDFIAYPNRRMYKLIKQF